MQDLQAMVLPSGIGIRFCDLTPKQLDDVLLAAAKSLPADGTNIELALIETRLGIEVMLQEITRGLCAKVDVMVEELDAPAPAGKPTGKMVASGEKVFDLNAPTNVWVPFAKDEYAQSIKSAKDHTVLKSLYQTRSKANPLEVMAILGKVIPVAR